MSLLVVENVCCRYRLHSHWLAGHKELKAVEKVSLQIAEGERLALAGESGSGKSTLARAILLLEPLASGKILFGGEDISTLKGRTQKNYRRQVQMVFQDAYSSMNPRMQVGEILAEPVRSFALEENEARITKRISNMLECCGLSAKVLERYPGELSGGECQRVALARALLPQPRLVVFDEATSSLDVTLQNQILGLLHQVRQQMDLTYLFITHNLAMLPHVADRVGIMQEGRLVEVLPAHQLAQGKHPYTQKLLAAAPVTHPKDRRALSR